MTIHIWILQVALISIDGLSTIDSHKKLININSVNVQFKKRKSFKGYGPAKKRQCGEGTYERSSNAESPGRETSYQDNANSVGWYVGQRSRSNLKYEVGALDVAINPVG